jgi:hypothetical protein
VRVNLASRSTSKTTCDNGHCAVTNKHDRAKNSLVLSTIGVTPFYNFTVPAIPLIPAILYDLYRATTILTQPSEDGWIIGVA